MNKTRNRFALGFVLGMFAMLVVLASVGAGIYFSQFGGSGKNTETVEGEPSKTSEDVAKATSQKVKYLQKIIDAYYLNDIDTEKLEEGVFKGLLAGLEDPYSVYYTKEEYDAFMEDSTGKYYGIGALVSQNADTGIITAINVFEDSPAYKAGMKSGDVIYKVEDKEVTGEDLSNVVAKMKGEKGTKVKITVYRSSENKYIELEITRDKVNVPTVEYKMLDKKNKIGYIQISQFEEVTYEQFTEAVESLQKQGMKAVIFDLRDNPGGLYSTVCDMLDDLLPEGTLVYTKDKYGKEEKQTSDEKCISIPMVVIQNGNSASASEIFAGAIQDFNAGQIVGEQSFGKGIVQTILPLTDGSAVKLTIQDYYTPSGKNIHGKGITPNVEVEDDIKTEQDEQLDKALEMILGLLK